jgi:cysteine desulfurase / selenocysteine lyase
MNAFFDSLGNTQYKELPEKLEAGTQNLAGILGFGEAINYINKVGIDNIHKKY